MNKRVFIVLADGFEEVEALGCIDFLRRCELEVVIAGLSDLTVIGSHSIEVKAEKLLDELNLEDFACMILPGGLPGSFYLYESEKVTETVLHFNAHNRLIAAICAAPMVLGKVGLLNDRCFTCYPGVTQGLEGLTSTNNMVEHDGNIITGKGPGATFLFAAQIATALGYGDKAQSVTEGMLL